MHATSLQGFGYDDVVHQFEKRCKWILKKWTKTQSVIIVKLIIVDKSVCH
ncbi:MAG: hypothetical protein O4805_24775 [Trichodesmium sp. St16_bin2-tuft]|nr:hypothetical protein [Trichodesmium sp. St16_bin2-tuft]